MADAGQVLRANGMGLVDELIHAAQMEGMAIPIAATIIAGESWGRNIWGHDTTVTAGTYTPGGAVTQANYLAYRTAMRAGRIKRNGAGPAQCTSAQYQDTADQLGGCWDPVANMRSGFRGMGALMKAYGTRDGARRYNGSGTQAERYADSFMSRLAIWESRLVGVPVPTITPAAVVPAAPPRPKVEPVIQNFPIVGSGSLELNTPIKGASGLYKAAYVSARSTQGNGHIDMWWGLSNVGGRGEAHWTLAANSRQWTELTGGDVDQATVHYNLGDGVLGVITVEFAPK